MAGELTLANAALTGRASNGRLVRAPDQGTSTLYREPNEHQEIVSMYLRNFRTKKQTVLNVIVGFAGLALLAFTCTVSANPPDENGNHNHGGGGGRWRGSAGRNDLLHNQRKFQRPA